MPSAGTVAVCKACVVLGDTEICDDATIVMELTGTEDVDTATEDMLNISFN